MMKKVLKIILSIVLIIIAVGVSLSSSSLNYEKLKDNGRLQETLTKKIAEVGGVWLSIKVASGIISFIQTIQIEGSIPVVGGLAVSAQPLGWAEVVDNTLDQISNICLWAMGALVLEKIILAVSYLLALKIIIPLGLIFTVIAIWNKKYSGHLKKILAGIAIIFFGICLAVPLSLELSHAVEASLLSNYINDTVNDIKGLSDNIEKNGEEANDLNLLRKIGSGINNFFNKIKNYFDSLIEKMINYIICFIVTNIIIPILTIILLKYLGSLALKLIGFTPNFNSIQSDIKLLVQKTGSQGSKNQIAKDTLMQEKN
ncbi:MAG: hypothetical protein FWB86_05670 [Treponema sp.]|nr:hypothetical protein [Treponema sp.]